MKLFRESPINGRLIPYNPPIDNSKRNLELHIEERLKMHRDNLRLWQDGTLNPTEPDEDERRAVMRGLMGAINELEVLEEFLNGGEK